jgi:hypothetical protein
LALDAVTLLKTLLDDRHEAWIKNSAAVTQLSLASMRLLITLEETFLAAGPPNHNDLPDAATRDRWRQRYAAAACQLREAGVDTTTDETAGAERYVKLRAGWNAHIERLAPAMGYGLEEVDRPASPQQRENTQAFWGRRPPACAM